jgi:hypothetical protein
VVQALLNQVLLVDQEVVEVTKHLAQVVIKVVILHLKEMVVVLVQFLVVVMD